MTTLLIIIGIATLVACIGTYKGWGIYEEDYYYDFPYFTHSFYTSIITVILFYIIGFTLPMDLTLKQTNFEIESLQDNTNISGNFFVGCGTIDGQMYYCMYLNRNGNIEYAKIDPEKVIIHYASKPLLKKYTLVKTKSWINYIALDWAYILDGKSYILEIPKGTIQNNYNLDTK